MFLLSTNSTAFFRYIISKEIELFFFPENGNGTEIMANISTQKFSLAFQSILGKSS